MQDYITHLYNILKATGEQVLENAGLTGHKEAMAKVEVEYKKYQVKTLPPVEIAYLETIKATEKKINKKKHENE